MSRELWVWIRVPLHALERAIASLKESVLRKHTMASRNESKRLRAEADADEAAAESLKQAMRSNERPPVVLKDDTK